MFPIIKRYPKTVYIAPAFEMKTVEDEQFLPKDKEQLLKQSKSDIIRQVHILFSYDFFKLNKNLTFYIEISGIQPISQATIHYGIKQMICMRLNGKQNMSPI